MSDNGNGAGEQLAQWLKEAGSRARRVDAAPAAADSDDTFNSPASLHRYLEELAGRRVNSRTEVLAFLKEVAGSRPLDHRAAELRRMVRELSLLALLALSYLHYYYWEVQLQIAALNSARVVHQAPASLEKKT
jgi:MoxR-like ATPase